MNIDLADPAFKPKCGYAATAHAVNRVEASITCAGWQDPQPGPDRPALVVIHASAVELAGPRRASGGIGKKQRGPVCVAATDAGLAQQIFTFTSFDAKFARLEPQVCATCTARIFRECAIPPAHEVVPHAIPPDRQANPAFPAFDSN